MSAGALPITHAPPAGEWTVEAIAAGNAEDARKLAAFGIVPGAVVRVLQTRPAYVLAVGYTEVALGRRTAACILVRPWK